MASVSSVSGLSSLAEDLYYQYLINNNSTSTMLNALSGTSSDSDSDTSSLMSAVSSSLSTSLSGITGLESLSSVLGSSSDSDSLLETSQAISNFSDILQVYMNSQTTEAANMAQSLSSVLEEAAATEDTSSLSYRTVQEIYQYFLDKSSSADQGSTSVTSQLQGSTSASSSTASTLATGSDLSTDMTTDLDFDSLEEELQQEAESQVIVPF